MPPKKIIKYPSINFDKDKEFFLKQFPFPSGLDVFQTTDLDIVHHYQTHHLVLKFCPNKICQRYDNELNLTYKSDSTAFLKCPVCHEHFPSRPKALKNLTGDHRSIYLHLYSFCLGHNHDQSVKFLGTGKQRGDKVTLFRKRMHSVIIKGLETEDKKLGGGVSNPVATDEMQKGVRRKGNGKQKSKPTVVHGDVQGACDNERYRFVMTPKKHRGAPRFEQIEENLAGWLNPSSTVMTDGAYAYIGFQDKYPQLVPYLMQLNHSVGEWSRQVTLEGKKMTATTNKIDGAWSHLRRFFSNHMVSQADAFRYLKEFEFFFGSWAKSQNALERLLHFMKLDLDLENIKGPELAAPWKDYSNSNNIVVLFFIFLLFRWNTVLNLGSLEKTPAGRNKLDGHKIFSETKLAVKKLDSCWWSLGRSVLVNFLLNNT